MTEDRFYEIHSSHLKVKKFLPVDELGKKFDISGRRSSLLSMLHGKNLQNAVKICAKKGKKLLNT